MATDKITYKDIIEPYVEVRGFSGGDVTTLRTLFPIDARDPFVATNPRTGKMEWVMPNTLIAQACHDAQLAANGA